MIKVTLIRNFEFAIAHYFNYIPDVWDGRRWRERQPWGRRLQRNRLCTCRSRCHRPKQQHHHPWLKVRLGPNETQVNCRMKVWIWLKAGPGCLYTPLSPRRSSYVHTCRITWPFPGRSAARDIYTWLCWKHMLEGQPPGRRLFNHIHYHDTLA